MNELIPQRYEVVPGVTLFFAQTDKFKTGMLSVLSVLPIDTERAWMNLLLMGVLRRGTKSSPSLSALSRRCDVLWGTDVNVRNFCVGDSLVMGLSADFLDKAFLPRGEDLLPRVTELLQELLFSPLTDEDGLLCHRHVESEKENRIDRIRAVKNNPRSHAADRFRELMHRETPYAAAFVSDEERVRALTAETLTAYWRELTASLPMTFFYVGSSEAEEVLETLRSTFGDALLRARTRTPHPDARLSTTRSEVRTDEERAVSQGHLWMGFCTGITLTDDEYYAAAVYNELLGGASFSKLFANVREKLGLCYHCGSEYSNARGSITVSCALSSANRSRAEKEILSQIEDLRRGRFTDEELDAARRSMMSNYRQIEDNPQALEGYYFRRSLADFRATPYACIEGFARVEREDVLRVASRMHLDTVYFLDGTARDGDGEEDVDADD